MNRGEQSVDRSWGKIGRAVCVVPVENLNVLGKLGWIFVVVPLAGIGLKMAYC